jgi:hypothetical protein
VSFLATAAPCTAVTISCIRDFGKETNLATTTLDPDLTETEVIKKFDDLVMSDSHAIQFSITDGGD